MEQRQTWLDEHLRLLQNNRVTRFLYAEKIAEDKATLREAIRIWISLWHDVLHLHTGLTDRTTNLDRTPQIARLAEQLSLATIRQALSSLEQTLERLDRNVNTRLTAEVLLLNLPLVRL